MNGRNWYDSYYDPLWSTLEELKMPVGFHESSSSAARQSGDQFEPNFMLRRAYAQPMEQMLALGSFCGGGVLERHPDLNVAFLEANCSWLPWLLWRLDEGYEREADVFVPDLKMAPSDYFRRQCIVSVEPDEVPAKYVIEHMGCDRMVFSTDYPHGDSRYPYAVDNFLELPISDDDKRKILWDNCAAFYSLDGVPAPSVSPQQRISGAHPPAGGWALCIRLQLRQQPGRAYACSSGCATKALAQLPRRLQPVGPRGSTVLPERTPYSPGSSTVAGTTPSSSSRAACISRRRVRITIASPLPRCSPSRSATGPMLSVIAWSCSRIPSMPVKLMPRCTSRSSR